MVQYLKRDGKADLAYVALEASDDGKNQPAIMFLGGFRSDMEGTKAIFLENMCREKGLGYVRFDYSGHGVSKGQFSEGCIGDWAGDAEDIMHALIEGPVILIGSSMGGWISLLLGRKYHEKIAGIIGLAAAPDFTKIMEERMSKARWDDINTHGYFELPNDYSDEPYVIKKKLIEDGRAQSLLDDVIDLKCPVRLIQGKKDADVAWETAHKIEKAISHDDVEVILLDEADHRLSAPDELEILKETTLKLL